MPLLAVGPETRESDDEFRARLRDFLSQHRPGSAPRARAERVAWHKAFLADLYDHGFAAPSWPTEVGGMDLPFARQVIHAEEMARAKAPGYLGTGVFIAGPTIIRFGTPEQQDRWLRPMIRSDQIWAQGFSEPEAGSDLPALRTVAQRDGAEYVVNGQKLWSSSADIADVLFCLVRTGPQESRQHGITYLVADARSPGITIRPIRDMTGGADFSEIHFDNVRVPVANRIGEENGGWAIARTSLGHERAANSLIQATRYRRVLDELLSLAGQRGLTSDPVVRQRLMRLETAVRIMIVSGARQIADIIANGEPGPASSVSRLAVSTFEQQIHEVAVDLLGPYAMLERRDPDAIERGRWVWGFLRTRASTIGAGTAEIQRNTVAERVLGLPREPE